MKLKKKYLLLPVITMAVILLCFFLPSEIFRLYDQEWTGKKVEKSANVSGLSIDSMPLSEKIYMIQDLTQIESALNGENTDLDTAILSRGYKLTKEEAWNNMITEFMKMAGDLASIMPEFYDYIVAIQDYNDAAAFFDSDSIQTVLVTDQEGNSTIIWCIGFQMDESFLNNTQVESYAAYSLPYTELYYDESSGYLLGAEIYNLDVSAIEKWANLLYAEWRDTDFLDNMGEMTIRDLTGLCFLKRYAEYIDWPVSSQTSEWDITSDTSVSMRTSKDNDTLNLICSAYLEMDHFLNIKLNRN